MTAYDDQGLLTEAPPQDHQAEVSLLGALMMDNQYIDDALRIVKAEDFYEPRHQIIFAAIADLARNNMAADLVTVANKLVAAGKLDAIGNRAYLVEVQEDVYSAANSDRYAEIVKEKAIQRRLMQHSAALFSKAQRMEGELSQLLEFAEKGLFEITSKNSSDTIRSQSEVAESYLRGLDEVVRSHDDPTIKESWIQTGIPPLDDLMFKFDPGLATAIFAESGHGKTVLAMQICDAQDRRGIHSAFINYEMPEEQLLGRYIQTRTALPAWRLRTGDLSDQELGLVYKEAARYAAGDCCIHLDNPKGLASVFEFRRRVRWYKKEFGIKVAVFDYFQKACVPGYRWSTRNEELTVASNLLMETASEFSIHLFPLSQKNRNDAGRVEKRPVMGDMKDTGSLGHDVNNIIAIWLPWLIPGDDKWKRMHPKNVVDLIVLKQREGPTGSAKVWWNPDLIRFQTLSSEQEALPL